MASTDWGDSIDEEFDAREAKALKRAGEASTPHRPWKRLLSMQILTLLLLSIVLTKDIYSRGHHLFSRANIKRVPSWKMRGVARNLLQKNAAGIPSVVGEDLGGRLLPPRGVRNDGLGGLWDPVCQLPGRRAWQLQ